MKHSRNVFRGIFGACMLAILLFGAVACTSQADKEAIQEAIKGKDYAEINNLMSLHSWYHAAMRNDLEVQNIWVSADGEFADTAIWAQTSGYMLGIDHIMEYYGNPDNKGAMPDPKGGFIWHTITTPVVEVAEDRQTAKGIWYTPGIVGEYKEDGTNSSQWMWEKYGVDFVRENGEWKVWHMKVYTDWSAPVGEAIGSMGGGGGAPGGAPPSGGVGAPGGAPPEGGFPEGGFPGGGTPPEGGMPPGATPEKQNVAETIGSELGPQGGGGMPPWDYSYKKQYRGWGKDTTVEMVPRPPEPYKTWSETWSYTDEGE